MIAALETASDIKPTVIGKPEPIMYQMAMEKMNALAETTAAIGDRVDTDILGGKRAGITTICILSGASDRAEAEASEADMIFDDLGQLLDVWMQTK